jgi:hypothetical protein
MINVPKGGQHFIWNRIWLTTVVVVFGVLTSMAQPYIVDNNRSLKVSDLRRDYGSLSFTSSIVGGRKIDDTTFDFAGNNEARMRLTLKATGKNNKWKKQMYVGISEKSFRLLNTNHWDPVRPKTTLFNTENGEVVLEFVCTKPGSYNVVLPFVFLDKADPAFIDPATWPVPPIENTIVTTNITILNLPTAADREWDDLVERNEVVSILKFILSDRGKGMRGAAIPIIAPLVQDDGRKYIFQTTDPIMFKAFLDKYEKYENENFTDIDKLMNSARFSLARPTSEPPANEPIKEPVSITPSNEKRAADAWGKAVAQQDTQLMNQYLKDYPGIIAGNDENALDSLRCWTPASYKFLKTSNGLVEYQLNNFIAPAYYDIYDGRLTIDDELLMKRKLLRIDVERSSKFNLAVVDKGCPHKQLVIPLDNLMGAAVFADTILGVYAFTFEGGTRPYALRLVPEDGIGKELLREKIQEGTFTLSVDSLQDAGLEGKYVANAYSGDSDSPVAVAGPTIDVPARPWPSWILPALIVVAVGAMALLLLFILRNGKPKQRTIFEEA